MRFYRHSARESDLTSASCAGGADSQAPELHQKQLSSRRDEIAASNS